MLTGRAAELRRDINYLHVHPAHLDVPQTPKTAMPGDFAQGLKLACLNASLRAKRDRMSRAQAAAVLAAEQGRPWIPRSGPGRRRAKANRNREAVAAMRHETGYIQNDETDAEPRAINARGFLFGILNWCNGQPDVGPLPDSEPIQMRREADGTIAVVGEAPRFLSISADLLTLASADYLTFADGVLTMAVQPEPLHYRPLGPDPSSFTVVFERVMEAM
jgi:hypothetical protein